LLVGAVTFEAGLFEDGEDFVREKGDVFSGLCGDKRSGGKQYGYRQKSDEITR
jgi:hypothetical protein